MKPKLRSETALALSLLREEVAASDLLPEPYARYRPLLADGLRFFLERLSSRRLRSILAEQMRMPVSTSTARRVVALLHHAPALHKLGQVVARDRRLDPGFRARLQELESLEPRLSMSAAIKLLDKHLKHWRGAGVELAPTPLAEGSVAVIVPFTFRDYNRGPIGAARRSSSLRDGVFKLLKPGVKDFLDEDLEIFGDLGAFLDQDCERYHLPPLEYQETFDTIRDLLLHEVRLEEEQHNLADAAAIYAGNEGVLVPALLPFCSPDVTAMERLYGRKIAEANLPGGASCRELGRIAAGALIAHSLFSPHPAALFHADPHAGNLLITPEGRVGILDWSLVGRLRKAPRIELLQIVLGAMTRDPGRMESAVARLTLRPEDTRAVRTVLQSSLAALGWRVLPTVTWLTDMLDRLVLHAGVRLEGDLLLFRKSLLTLEGVLADLSHTSVQASASLVDEEVIGAFLSQWAVEWPARWFAPFAARSLPTHLSNADLLSVLWAGPMIAARWWTEAAGLIWRRAQIGSSAMA